MTVLLVIRERTNNAVMREVCAFTSDVECDALVTQ